MHGGDVNAQGPEGRPIWADALLAGHPEAVDELLESGVDVNVRDPEGNGWLHWSIGAGLSEETVLAGLRLQDRTWWHPNHQGDTPLHLFPISTELAQGLGARVWSDRISWRELAQGRDPEHVALTFGAEKLARIWAEWRARCLP